MQVHAGPLKLTNLGHNFLHMSYTPSPIRYDTMEYRRCGRSGLLLPAVSLGLWHNFGHVDVLENCRKILHLAFDSGITHFDLANNYGPPPRSGGGRFCGVGEGKIPKYPVG